MISVIIDGKIYPAEQGQHLLQFTAQHGILLPSLCYYEHIQPPLGTCRVCTVKVNGRPIAGCQVHLEDNMNIELQSEALIDLRKAMVEMLFAEGNHYCPVCEKSGDCDLQGLGYQLGVRVLRFPHLFVDRIIDFRPKRMVIEHNRCIRCRRCVEEVHNSEGKKIFYFVNRANRTEVAIDYEEEKKLSEAEAIHAMHICPVGAILVKGNSQRRPIGERKYDIEGEMPDEEEPHIDTKGKKITVATAALAGCFGCHMSLLDIDEELVDLIEVVDFNRSPLTDIKNFTKRCDIGIIEGGCANTENVEVLREFREKCDVLVAIGECAIWGGLPAMRNTLDLGSCLEEAYLNSITSDKNSEVPGSEDIPKILDRVYGCNEVVHIDYYIPGCPPSAGHIWKVVKNIAFGNNYSILKSEFKYD